MLNQVKLNILIMNEKVGDFGREIETIKENQMKIL